MVWLVWVSDGGNVETTIAADACASFSDVSVTSPKLISLSVRFLNPKTN